MIRIVLVEDSIKRLARVTDRENHVFEVIEDLTDNVEIPCICNRTQSFPKGDKLELVTQKATELELELFGPSCRLVCG